MEMCLQNLLRLTSLEWYSFQLKGYVNYSSISLTLLYAQQRENTDEIMWEFQMYFWMKLFAMDSIESDH